MLNNNNKRIFSVIAGIMLLLAIPPIWPYAYFQILRWVVAGSSIYIAYIANENKKNNWAIMMLGVAITFNPIAPIYFSKGTWSLLDLIAAIIIFVSIKKV